jgi:hypothetical protein
MRILSAILLLTLFVASNIFSQETNGIYEIDNSIKEKIENKVFNFDSLTLGSMDFKMYSDDSIIANTFAENERSQCITMAFLENDTIFITGFIGMFSGFGYKLFLIDGSFSVYFFAKFDAQILKLNKDDSLNFGIDVPCKSFSLVLVEKPAFKNGELVEGIIKLESEDFYEVSDGKESKLRIELTGYFSVKVSE